MENLNIVPSGSRASWESEIQLARRRYQKGTLEIHNGQWTLRYLEDVQTVDSTEPKRIGRRVYLGGSPPAMTEKIARRRADEIMAGVNSTSAPRKIITFNEFVARWEPLAMPKTETARNFRTALNRYLKPAFGKVQLADIQTERVQRFISTVPTGAPNIHNIIKCLRAIWKSARAWGYVNFNPFDGLVLPRIPKTDRPFFNEMQLCRILTAAPEPDKTLYWVLAQTGLRIGEVLALTWETLNLEHGLVRVESSVARGKLREQVTKTKAAKRVIPLSPAILNHLFTFRTNWKPNLHNLVFANTKGNPWKAENLLEGHLQPLLDALEIPRAGFHAFRHASASLLERMKASPKIRLERMGHTEESMTMIYTHIIDDDARQIAAQYDQFLLPEKAMKVGA